MKKIILSLILAGCLVLPVLSLAQVEDWDVPEGSPRDVPLQSQLRTLSVMDTLEIIADWIFYILLFVAAIFIVIAGVNFVTAQGDPEKVKKARDMVMYAVIGIIVALLARGIVALVNVAVGT
jgi:membrane-associated HD superfamily phosphohydrolase